MSENSAVRMFLGSYIHNAYSSVYCNSYLWVSAVVALGCHGGIIPGHTTIYGMRHFYSQESRLILGYISDIDLACTRVSGYPCVATASSGLHLQTLFEKMPEISGIYCLSWVSPVD